MEGDIVLTTKGTVGRIAIVPSLPRQAVYSPQVCYFRIADGSCIDRRWLFYWLQSEQFWSQARDRMNNTDMAAYINLSDMGSLALEIPTRSDQIAIAEVLGALDDKIAANQRTAHASWALSAALYSQVSRNAGGSVLLGDLVATQYGLTTPATGGPAQLLRVTDINKRPWITWESVPFCDPSPADMIRYKLAPGDIVVARMADPGKSAWISSDPLEAVFASYLVRLKVHDPTQSAFVYHFLQSQAYLDYVQFSKQGSVQSNMNAKVIVNCPMPDPGKVDLKTFNEKASLLRQTIDISLAEASRLEALRDTLLPALMSGKLHVRDAERAVEDVL
ncbi:hypothetical protein C5C49_08365 [Rathayibacter sp. AY1E2]|nr:hypothetical protein C5C49_08365 [Rathayibacter sp. AY1E2]